MAEAKINYKKRIEDSTVWESWETPEGKKVEQVTTYNWNEQSTKDQRKFHDEVSTDEIRKLTIGSIFPGMGGKK